MQKAISSSRIGIAVFASLIVGHSAAHAQTQSARDSIVTVEQLLKHDNALARDKATKDLAAAGLLPATQQSVVKLKSDKPVETRASLTVHKIAGVSGQLRADVVFNGSQMNDLTVGSRVGGCTVTSIANQCVSLAPVHAAIKNETVKGGRKSTAKDAKSTAPALCPTSCWTGIPAPDMGRGMFAGQMGGNVAQTISGVVMPPPGGPGTPALHIPQPSNPAK